MLSFPSNKQFREWVIKTTGASSSALSVWLVGGPIPQKHFEKIDVFPNVGPLSKSSFKGFHIDFDKIEMQRETLLELRAKFTKCSYFFAWAADLCCVSVPTVNLWLRGTLIPDNKFELFLKPIKKGALK